MLCLFRFRYINKDSGTLGALGYRVTLENRTQNGQNAPYITFWNDFILFFFSLLKYLLLEFYLISKQDATTYLKGIVGCGGFGVCLFLFFSCGWGIGRGIKNDNIRFICRNDGYIYTSMNRFENMHHHWRFGCLADIL